MYSVNTLLPALAPIFFLIALGFWIRRKSLIDPQFWLPCEKLNYFCMFPALMFTQVARADFGDYPVSSLAVALLGAVGVGAAVLYLWKMASRQGGPAFSSVLQGALRPNTYVAVAAAGLLFGASGLTLASLSIAIAIPILNVASVMALMVHSGQGRPSLGALLGALLKNPVILSVSAGLLYKVLHLPQPQMAFSVLNILGSASLPLGLLAIGAGLDLGSVGAARGAVALSSVVKLLIVPGLTAVLGHAMGLPDTVLAIAVLFNAMPCSPSTYVMTKLMGGDHRLAASIISVQTVMAVLTIPIVMASASWLHF